MLKVSFKFEKYLQLEARSCYILLMKYLLISSLYCKLCTLKQYSRLFLSEQQPCSFAVLRNKCNLY